MATRSNSNFAWARIVFCVWGIAALAAPARTQEQSSFVPDVHAIHSNWGISLVEWRVRLGPAARFDVAPPDYRHEFVREKETALLLPKPLNAPSRDTIEKMEAAFSCNDTLFVDQVRLPVAALWHGRVKLTGFESDVTTANFVLGPPGAGTLSSLSMFGSGHLATRTPPSDQLVGMHVTFSFSGNSTESGDNSGLHGLEHLARGGRNFLQTLVR